jgi:hypothetical protein
MAWLAKKRYSKGNKKDVELITRHLTGELVTSIDPEERKFRVVSIDPGLRNLAIRVEDRDGNKVPKPIIFCKWDIKLVNKELPDNLEILPGVKDSNCNYLELIRKLDNHLDIINKANIIIIERQLPFNYDPNRIMQHLLAYFQITLKDTGAVIYEIDSHVKGNVFNRPKGVDLKAWTVEIAIEELNLRNDVWSLEVIENYPKKQDDLADVVIQLEATLRSIGLSDEECWDAPKTKKKIKLKNSCIK